MVFCLDETRIWGAVHVVRCRSLIATRIQVLGLEDPSQRHLREPTFAVARREPGGGFVHPELLTSALCRAGAR